MLHSWKQLNDDENTYTYLSISHINLNFMHDISCIFYMFQNIDNIPRRDASHDLQIEGYSSIERRLRLEVGQQVSYTASRLSRLSIGKERGNGKGNYIRCVSKFTTLYLFLLLDLSHDICSILIKTCLSASIKLN